MYTLTLETPLVGGRGLDRTSNALVLQKESCFYFLNESFERTSTEFEGHYLLEVQKRIYFRNGGQLFVREPTRKDTAI